MNFEKSKINNIEWEDIDHSDYPDYCDAHIVSADYDGREMTDEELEDLNCNHSDIIYDLLMSHLY